MSSQNSALARSRSHHRPSGSLPGHKSLPQSSEGPWRGVTFLRRQPSRMSLCVGALDGAAQQIGEHPQNPPGGSHATRQRGSADLRRHHERGRTASQGTGTACAQRAPTQVHCRNRHQRLRDFEIIDGARRSHLSSRTTPAGSQSTAWVPNVGHTRAHSRERCPQDRRVKCSCARQRSCECWNRR